MIKINQVTSPSQADQLRGADMLGVCICRDTSLVPGPYTALGSAQAIHAVVPEVPLSVAFNEADGFTPMEVEDAFVDCGATFFEFTPVDFHKSDAFARQLDALRLVDAPKIANGFFVEADELGFVDDAAGFRALQEVGVEYFQFEVRSAVVPSRAIPEAALARVDAFFATVPAIAADQVVRVQPYPLANVRGMYFNLRPMVGDLATYDFTELTFPLSRARSIVSEPRPRTVGP